MCAFLKVINLFIKLLWKYISIYKPTEVSSACIMIISRSLFPEGACSLLNSVKAFILPKLFST